jgi:signal recognition particle receptor subunit beta
MVQDVFSLLRPNEGRRRNTSFGGLSTLLATSATPVQRTEPVGTELRHLLDALAQSGRELHGVADGALAAHIKEVLDRMAAISCRIAVVGQVKAGKSSFINAVMQRGDLLPTHVNPWTAVATKLHFGTPGKPLAGCDFTFFTAEEWAALGLKASGGQDGAEFEDGFAEMKSRAEIRLGERFHHLLGKTHFYQSVQAGVLQNYLCAGPPVDEVSREIKPGRYADITKSANIYFALPPLAVPAILVDTPGTNDSTHLRVRITREIIEGADIYIVVLTARQALASSDLGLLKLLRGLEKKRIIVFINRIDELNDAVAADQVVKHVKDELRKVFESLFIPVVAGSAKWAGFAAHDDVERLRQEVKAPSFRAFAAQRCIAIPPEEEEGGDLSKLQTCFRTASGLDSVTRLLSLFMLSGFVSNHVRGVASVLLSAAEISATNARRELHSITGLLHDIRDQRSIGQNGVDPLNARLAEIKSLLGDIGNCVQTLKEQYGPAIRDGVARLEFALEADIRSFAEPQKPAAEAADVPATGAGNIGKASDSWTFDVQPPRVGTEQDAAIVTERSSWLASVKEATFGLLRRTRAENPQTARTETRPSNVRQSSLTVPVMAHTKDVTIDSGVSWWSEWMSNQHQAPRSGEELVQIVKREFALPQDGKGGRERLQDFSDLSAKTGLASIAPLIQLASTFRSLQTEENGRLADFIAEHEAAVTDACLTIAVYEKVTQQVRALFVPQTTSG